MLYTIDKLSKLETILAHNMHCISCDGLSCIEAECEFYCENNCIIHKGAIGSFLEFCLNENIETTENRFEYKNDTLLNKMLPFLEHNRLNYHTVKLLSSYIKSNHHNLYSKQMFELACENLFHVNLFVHEETPQIGLRNPWNYEAYKKSDSNSAVDTFFKDYESYTNSLKSVNNDNIETYEYFDVGKLLCRSFIAIIEARYKFKTCANCGKLFIPYNRSDEKYCNKISPQDNNMTCKEYGSKMTYLENLKSNEAMGLYRKIYMQKQMLTKRNPDIKSYTEDFEQYKLLTKHWKSAVRLGTKTKNEYIQWLKEIKGKRL